MEPLLSIVIPTLNAAAGLPETLAALDEAAGWPCEAVVADGGSADGTADIALAAGARVIDSPRGRGPQMIAGAAAARGAWLLFLHADSVPAPGWARAAAGFINGPDSSARAAYFRFRLDDDTAPARRVVRLTEWRCRRLGLPYGDQGLLIGQNFYGQLGGYRPLVLMEDVDLVRRIGRQRLVALDHDTVTSAARYRRDGYWKRPLRNLFCLTLFTLGVPAGRVARLYE